MLMEIVLPWFKCSTGAICGNLIRFETSLHAMPHISVLASSQACTSPNKICHSNKNLVSLLHSLFRQNSSSGCGRNAELLSAQVRHELSV